MGRPRSVNTYTINGNVVYLHLIHGDCIVDLECLDKVLKVRWHTKLAKATNKYYVYGHSYGNEKKYLISRYILNVVDKDKIVDHINGDPLDNRLANLRIGTKAKNNYNAKKRKNGTSKYKGVSKVVYDRYVSTITHKGKRYYLGTFGSEREAGLAYNKKAVELFGDFAKLNEIKDKK